MSYALLRRLARPLWLVFALMVLGCSPVLAVLARLVGAITGRPEPVALIRLLVVYVSGELAMITSPTASHEQRLDQLTRFLDDVVTTAMRTLRVRVELHSAPAASAALKRHDRPMLVFSRHAGPGDSVLLVHMLLARFGREPAIVMKEIVTLDPIVAVIAQDLHCALIGSAGDDVGKVTEVARKLGPSGALLLFPEGGNFTPQRRSRAIAWLRRSGHATRAAHGERLKHLMAPHARGVVAAMDGAPQADVIFIAHTGLGRAAKGLRILRELPRDTTVRIQLWHVPANELPREEPQRVAWLDGWWGRLDAWVEVQGRE